MPSHERRRNRAVRYMTIRLDHDLVQAGKGLAERKGIMTLNGLLRQLLTEAVRLDAEQEAAS